MFCSLQMLVLCAHFFPKLESNEQMWFLTETITNAKDNRRYISVYELGRSLSPTACQILPVAQFGNFVITLIHLVVVEPDLLQALL
jgi:hypothetical protein